ncbi:MAG TPA: hypothetical protein PK798_01830 [Flavobacteriales bacterium]|nr:hypothetical protein [Flavobacteriales bacterium]HRJ37495.1 hypothetical protein [Flavobacteriales bacterium]
MKYHIENDPSYLQFTGMNYPYGEHYGFTDGMPAFTWLFQTVPALQAYAIPIIHLSLFANLVLCALFVFLILKKFEISQWFAAIASIGILILQPQIHRLTGHPSLSFASFFPIAWYILICYLENPSRFLKILLIINPLFWFFIHAYLGFMIVLFYLFSFIVIGITQREKGLKSQLWNIGFSVLPVIIFFSFIKLTDTITDRPTDPTGLFDYTASMRSVFLPSHPPLNTFFHSMFESTNPGSWEGWSYIGITATVAVFAVFLSLFIQLFKTRSIQSAISNTVPFHVRPYILPAILILLFSFGIPFNIFPKLLDYITPVKQFRGLGRFAWVFYYVSTLLSVTILYYWWKKSRTENKLKRIVSTSVCIIGISLFFIEGLPYHQSIKPFLMAKNCFESEHLFDSEQNLIKLASDYDAQAIMTLPYFHIGSEIFGKEASPETIRKCFLLSYYLKKPIFGVMMGRTSFQQSMDYMRVFGPAQIEKRMRAVLSPDKPLLVYYGGERLWEEELRIKKLLHPIQTDESTGLYLLYPKDLLMEDPDFTYAKFKNNTDTLISYQDVFIDQSINNEFHWENFEDSLKWAGFYSNGRYHGQTKTYNTIMTIPENTLRKDSTYEVGFEYFWTSGPIALNNVVIIQTSLPEGGNVKWIYERCLFSFPVQEYGKTTFCAQFVIEDTTQRIDIVLKGPDNKEEFEVDHLFLKKPNVIVLRKNENSVWTLNNIPFPK